MAHLPAALDAVFPRQHGVVSFDQLIQAGLTRDRVRNLVRRRRLIRVVSGSYRLATHPDTELARCVAVSLAFPDAVVCGPTAGRLFGFRRLPSDGRLHLLLPHGARLPELEGLAGYRPIDAGERRYRERPDGIRVLAAADAVVDLARRVGRPCAELDRRTRGPRRPLLATIDPDRDDTAAQPAAPLDPHARGGPREPPARRCGGL